MINYRAMDEMTLAVEEKFMELITEFEMFMMGNRQEEVTQDADTWSTEPEEDTYSENGTDMV